MHDPFADADETRALADEAPPAVEGGTIAGRVRDFEDVPMVGVRVEAADSQGQDLDLLPVMTDGEGRFTLAGLAEGAYDLRFVLGRVAARTLGVRAGTTDLEVRLARPQGLLLVVRGSPDDPPPALLHVVVEREGKDGPVREHVGRHLTSRMLLWSLRPGTYTLRVWGGPYLPVEANGVQVEDGKPAPQVDVVLGARGGEVSGRVWDAEGLPVSGALLCWRPLDRASPWPETESTATADEDGAFRIRGLPSGRYRISAARTGGDVGETEVDVVEEQTARADVTLLA